MHEHFSIVGTTKSRWGQTFSDENLFLVLELDGDDKIQERGRSIIEQIEDTYQTHTPDTLKATAAIIESLDLPKNASIMIGVAFEKTLYVASHGACHAYIKRGDTFAELLTSKGNISGPIQKEDVLILSTPSFIEYVTRQSLSEAVSKTPFGELEDELAGRIHELDSSDGAACMIVRFDKAREEAVENEGSEEEIIETSTIKDVDEHINKPQGAKTTAFFKNIKRSVQKSNVLYSKHRRLTASIGLVLAGLLVTSLVFGSQHKTATLQKQSFEQVLGDVSGPLEEAESLISLNPQDAYEDLVDLEATVTEAIAQFPEESSERAKLQELLQQIELAIERSQRKYTLDQAPVFFDLKWVKETAHGTRLAFYENMIVVLDPDNQSAYALTADSKKSDIIASDDALLAATDVGLHGTTVSYFITDEDQRVVDNKLRTGISNDEDWGTITSMHSYAGNLYLLDTKGAIWKYAQIEGDFGPRQSYLGDEVEIDLSDSIDMAIDGAIWVLADNNIKKFAIGRPDVFFIQDEGLANPKALYTNEGLDYLYILEQDRVLVLDKEGNYHQQYVWDGVERAVDLIVSAELNTLIVLSDGKLLGIELEE